MHFHHHLNHPAAQSAGKLGFLVSTLRYDGLYYLEYDENHDWSATPIQRIAKVNFTPTFEYLSFRLVGSINGLICLLPRFQRQPSVYICNPITREYLILPEIRMRDCDTNGYNYEETCFVCVPSTNEYKDVGFYKLETVTNFEVLIYTLGSGNGWRNLGKFNHGSNLGLKFKVFFANGALYWVDDELEMICTFDLAEEKFVEHLSPPHLPPNGDWYYCSIGVLDGFLFFALWDEGDGFSDVWILKEKNHNHDMEEAAEHRPLSWNKEFRIDDMDSMYLLAVTKSDGILTRRDSYYINIYDTKSSTSKSLVKFKSRIIQIAPHRNTLVSLKELGKEDTKVMESAKFEEIKIPEQLQKDAFPEYIYI